MTDDTQAVSPRDSNKEQDVETDREQPRVLPKQKQPPKEVGLYRANTHTLSSVWARDSSLARGDDEKKAGPDGGIVDTNAAAWIWEHRRNLVVSPLEDESQRARLGWVKVNCLRAGLVQTEPQSVAAGLLFRIREKMAQAY